MRDLKSLRTLIVKVGTALCMRDDNPERGDAPPRPPRLDGPTLIALAQQMAVLRGRGCRIVLVTSGAVGMGRALLGVDGIVDLAEKQALAAVGQVAIMNAWQNIFSLLDLRVAQVLVTRHDMEAHDRYLNARNALAALLRRGILPVVNENDSVATEEIAIGDNDQLAALVGSLVDADLVVNLTSADGLLDGDGRVVPTVSSIDAVEALVRDSRTRLGTGGMGTKLQAARIAQGYGAHMAIVPGRAPNVLLRLMDGEEIGTLFVPEGRRVRGRKRWMAFAGRPCGVLRVDAGAMQAVSGKGRSLLAAGVTAIEGRFEVGDLVRIEGPAGERIGRGLTNYGSDHVALIQGQPTERFESILGFKGNDELIHRDHLVLD